MINNQLISEFLERTKAERGESYLLSFQEYVDSVNFLAGNYKETNSDCKNLEFNNKDQHHGIYVMSTIFSKANKGDEIKIFARNFGGKICDDALYLNELSNAIERGVHIDIVFEQKPANSKCIQMLKEIKGRDQKVPISIKILDAKYLKMLNDKTKGGSNFTVLKSKDYIMYRYESDPINYKAFCNCDDKIVGDILLTNFITLSIKSTPYSDGWNES